MLRRFFFAGLAAIGMVSAVNASTITYSLIPGVPANSWVLTASTSAGDNFGLNFYAVTVTGAATISHVNVSPKLTDFDAGLTYGFAFARSADGVSVISAGQDSTGGGFPVYGIGQQAGTLKAATPSGATTGAGKPDSIGTYASPVVLATGTYTTVPPVMVPAGSSGLVFNNNSGNYLPGAFGAPTGFVFNQFPAVPEPASIALFGLALAGGASLRRRRA